MAALPNGARLGPYEILAPLGAGGMGEVYRARDTRLGRAVAIKLLNAELSGDAISRSASSAKPGASRPSPIRTSAPCTTSAITRAMRSS